MRSKWELLKPEAIRLRKNGLSIGSIEHKLGIPRSTLSGWFKHVTLTKLQRQKLHRNWQNALVKARKKAVIWHNQQKQERMHRAKQEAAKVLENIDTTNTHVIELALAVLYLAEGSKKK